MSIKKILKAQNEGTDSAGGYLVAEVFSNKLFEYMRERATASLVMTNIMMSTDTLHFPKLTAGVSTYWVGENTAITASQTTYGQLTLTPKKIAAYVLLSTEVMEDSDPSIMEVVMKDMASKLALAIDEELFNGDGTNLTGWRATSGINTVASVGTNGDALTTTQISSGIKEGRLDNHRYTHLFIHPNLTHKLRILEDTAGNLLFSEANWGSPLLQHGVIGTIYGLKVVETAQIKTDITKGSGTTLSELFLVEEKNCGIFAVRRKPMLKKAEILINDQWEVQITSRVAFGVQYPEAICVISDLITA